MKIRNLILLLTGILFFLASQVKSQKDNIICILVDDLGYGDLSCQGATDLRSPNIDRIASQGLTFSNFYANCPVCSPSRASILSGKYPDMVGVPGVIRQWDKNSWGYLEASTVFIPEVLKKYGYHTAIIGKWHLGFEEPNTPNGTGFDYFKGFLGDMMDDYYTHLRGGVNWMRFNQEIIDPKGHATDLFTDWAVEYMEIRKEDKKPFFLYLAYNAPHFPIQPPEEYLKKVQAREPGLSEKRSRNVAFVEHLDFCVGRVMDYLEESGLISNTLVVFTSDNGGSLPHAQSNGLLRGSKQQMYEGGIKVPAFALWQEKIGPGSRTDQVVVLMDLFPTFAEIAGVQNIPEVDGISILPLLRGEQQNTTERYLFWVRREGGRYGGQAYYAARFGDFKILQNSAYEPFQYFLIGADPYEENPLQEGDYEEFQELRIRLREHIRKSGSVPWQKPDN